MTKHSFKAYLTEQQSTDMQKANKSYGIVHELAFTLLTCSSDHLEQIFSNHPEKLKQVINHFVSLHNRLETNKQLVLEAMHQANLVLDNLEREGKA